VTLFVLQESKNLHRNIHNTAEKIKSSCASDTRIVKNKTRGNGNNEKFAFSLDTESE
jgi:hypothetical protein